LIDLHSHVLPGLDDGAATLADSLAMLEAAAADGTSVLAATPHVREDYATTPEQMRAALRELREAAAETGLAVEVVPGGEIALSQLATTPRETLREFGLGGSPNHLLVEFPYHGWPPDLAMLLVDLLDDGVVPVLAHPERSAEVQHAPARLAPLVAEGVLVQVTSASLTGELGRASRDAGLRLVHEGLAHLISSDAHTPDARATGLSRARSAVGFDRLGAWLTEAVPAAIVSGERRVPERPDGRRG
jgi:protein-tyrosine phosphatase